MKKNVILRPNNKVRMIDQEKYDEVEPRSQPINYINWNGHLKKPSIQMFSHEKN